MHVEPRGRLWAVMDADMVIQVLPTNAAAWSYIDRIERRAQMPRRDTTNG